MPLFRDFRDLTTAGETPATIAADSANIVILLDDVDTGNPERESLKTNLDEAVSILNEKGVGATQIAESATATLNNAGDFFDFDVSALTPSPVGRKLLSTVLEKGTAGGELFAQELEYNQNYIGSNKYISSVFVEEKRKIYQIPFAASQVLVQEVDVKNSYLINTVVTDGGGNPAAKLNGGVYDPQNRKIFCSTNSGLNALIIDVDTEVLTEIATGSLSSNPVLGSDGLVYWIQGITTTTSVLKSIDLSTNAVNSSVATITHSSSGAVRNNYTNLTVFGDILYTGQFFTTVDTLQGAWIDIKAVTPTFNKFTANTHRKQGGVLIGDKIIYAPLDTTTDLEVIDISTPTAPTSSSVAVGLNGWQGGTLLGNSVWFAPRTATGFLKVNADLTFEIIGTITGVLYPISYDDEYIVPALFTATRPFEFDVLEPFNISPSNPAPYFSATNLFDSSGATNKVASLEDYILDITEDGGGNITNIRCTMLTEGQKDVTLNVVYSGF